MCCMWFAHDCNRATYLRIGDSSRRSEEIVWQIWIAPLNVIIINIIITVDVVAGCGPNDQ